MKLLFTTLFLPTGLILLGIAAALWLLYKTPKKTGLVMALLGATLAGGYLLATPLMGLALSQSLFNAVQARQLASLSEADAIVVLTAGIYDSGPMGWLPRAESIQRLAVAYEAQRRINLRLPVIVSGGHTEGVQNPSEARVSADFFARNRSEITPTELEEASTDTYESALQLAPVLSRRGAKNVLLVTSDVHVLRALAIYRAHGIDAVPLPALSTPHNLGARAFVPSVYGLALTTSALYEVYGIVLHLLTGRIGLRDLTYTIPVPPLSPTNESNLHVRP